MTHPLHDVPSGFDPPRVMNVFVEIARGSRNKYELDKETGILRLDRVLYSAVHYPGDYGFFPRTLGEDGDPLDALVMLTEPTFPGCLIPVRPIGAFVMTDEKGRDEKVLCVPTEDPLYSTYQTLNDVAPHFLREVEHFFAVYKDLEGKRTVTEGWVAVEVAHRVILDALARYAP